MKKHGLSGTPEYTCWAHMMDRCYNPRSHLWNYYGQRGVVVCDRWRSSFLAFLADMGKRPTSQHSIDRIDNAGNYEPDNCRWATKHEQRTNQRSARRTNVITIDGQTLTLADWCRAFGMPYYTVEARIRRHKWEPLRALTQRIRRRPS